MDITTAYQKERHDFGINTETVSYKAQGGRHSGGVRLAPGPDYSRSTSSATRPSAHSGDSGHVRVLRQHRPVFKSRSLAHTHTHTWPSSRRDCTEKDQTVRYKKKVEKDEEYIKQVKSLGDAVEGDIKQNYAIDIYQEYFAGEYADHSSEPPSAKTLSVFKDPSEIKRTVSNISWYPDGGKKLAVAFAIMQFQDPRMDKDDDLSYIWDVNNPNTPEQRSRPLAALLPRVQPEGPAPARRRLVQRPGLRLRHAHGRDAEGDVDHREVASRPRVQDRVAAGKTPFECASTSTDGQVLWWDIRRLGEPSECCCICEDKPPRRPAGAADGRRLDGVLGGGRPDQVPRRHRAGQDRLVLAQGQDARRQDRHDLRGPLRPRLRPAAQPVLPQVLPHRRRLDGAAVERGAARADHDVQVLLELRARRAWSPTRPGVFCTTKMDGTLDVWDYFYKQNDPTLSLQVDGDGL